MKLAEALSIRKDLQVRIAQLGPRIQANVNIVDVNSSIKCEMSDYIIIFAAILQEDGYDYRKKQTDVTGSMMFFRRCK